MLSRFGVRLDALTHYAEAAAASVGTVTGIVLAAVGDISAELGSLASQLSEIRESAGRAGDD